MKPKKDPKKTEKTPPSSNIPESPAKIEVFNFGALCDLENAVAQSCALNELLLGRIVESPQYEDGSKIKEYFDFGLLILLENAKKQLRAAEDKVTKYVQQIKPPKSAINSFN